MVTEQELPSGVRLYQCNSWEDFTSQVRQTKFVADRIFRGHADSKWKLSSVWERWLDTKRPGLKANLSPREVFAPNAFESIRDSYLERFKKQAKLIPGFQSHTLVSDQDWWALGRHHGLVTPLLDWTYSPYIASFFAFKGYFEKWNPEAYTSIGKVIHYGGTPVEYVAIWGLVCVEKLFVNKDEFELISSHPDNAQRQIAQRGVFTYLDHSMYTDLEAYLEGEQKGIYLEKYEIPVSEVNKALWDLWLMNITYAAMHPGLDGAAQEANFTDNYFHFSLSVNTP